MEETGLERVGKEVLQKAGIEKNVIVRMSSDDLGLKPRFEVTQDGQLEITAIHEAEVRRLTGRFVVKQMFPGYKWLLAAHPYRFAVIPSLLIVLVTLLELLGITAFQDLSISISIISEIIIASILIFFSYTASLRYHKWKSEFSEYMREIDAVTAYDGDEYETDQHASVLTMASSAGISILLLILKSEVSAIELDIISPIALVALFASALTLFVEMQRGFFDESCFDETDWIDDELRDPTTSEANIASRLSAQIAGEIDELNLSDYFERETGLDASKIDVDYREIPFPHCRLFHYYTDEDTLIFEVNDLNQPSAIHFVDSRLRRLATPYFKELGLRWRVLIIFNLLFLIFFYLTLPLVWYAFGILGGQLTLLAGGIIMMVTSWINYKNHQKAQESYRSLLDESKYMTDYDKQYYYDSLFANMTAYDIKLLAAFLVLAAIVELIIYLLF